MIGAARHGLRAKMGSLPRIKSLRVYFTTQSLSIKGVADSQTLSRHKHRHFKWAPKFGDIQKSIDASPPGNDGWAIHNSFTRYKAFPPLITPKAILLMSIQCHAFQGQLHARIQHSPRGTQAVSKWTCT